MLAEEYYALEKGLSEKGIIFSFTGYISEKVLFALGDALKQKMALIDADRSRTKKVFSVFVEQVQNIIRYSSERISGGKGQELVMSPGVITVGAEGDRFFVVCGNVVDRTRKAILKHKLEHLSSLDKAELKSFYKHQLREPPDGDSQGGSLGLIEIARRSSEPVEYDFLDLDQDRTFFCLKAYI